MARNCRGAEQIIPILRKAEVSISQGKTVLEVCREIGVTEQTYYRWRKEYGGLRMDQAKRLKGLEKENGRLKKLLAESELDKEILKEAISGDAKHISNSEPSKATSDGGICSRCVGARAGVRASSVSSTRPTSFNSTSSGPCTGRRTPFGQGDDRFGVALWPLWLSPDNENALLGRLAGESQADRASLETRRSESAEKTAQKEKVMAERWLVYSFASEIQASCVELRFRPLPHPRWQTGSFTGDHR